MEQFDFTIEKERFAKATCRIAVQHLRNVHQLQQETGSSLGYHSRFLELLFHPEDKLIFRGYSKDFWDGKGARYKEHIVPMAFAMDTLWRWMDTGEKTDEQMATALESALGVAYITHEEAGRLDNEPANLKTTMPNGWRLGQDDPIARLHAVGIVLVDEDGNEIHSLLSGE